MANIPLQYPFPYKTTNNTGFTSSVEFNTVTVLGDVTIDQNLTVAGNITTTDLTVGDDLTVGGTMDAAALRAFGIWDSPTATVTGAGSWIGFDSTGHTIFANRKSTAGQTNSFRWYSYSETNAFQAELMRLSNTGNLFIAGTRIEFPLIHLHQPSGTYPNYDFYLPTSMGSAGQVLTSAGVGNPTYWTTPSGGGGGGGTVTNVSAGTMPSAMTMTITSPTTTPVINIAATTVGSNAFVRKDVANMTELTINGAPAANLYITSGTVGVGSLANTSTIYLTQVGGGGGFVNQWIQAAYNATNGYHISMNCNDDFVVNASDTCLLGTLNVGSTSPASGAKLQVNNGDVRIEQSASFGSNIGLAIKRLGDPTPANNSEWYTYIPTGSSDLRIYSANLGAAVITYKTTGNVGIGTLAPTEKLDIIGGLKCDGIINNASYFMKSVANDTTMIITNGFGAFGAIEVSNIANTVKRNLSLCPYGGNVGVGTTSPATNLEIRNSATAGTRRSLLRLTTAESTAGTGINFDFVQDVTVVSQISSVEEAAAVIGLRFSTFNAGLTSDCVAISGSGNVGIGTTSPSQKLHVNGGRIRISDSADSVLEIFSGSFQNYLYTKSADGHFIVDVSTRNVGIGTTTPGSKLTVNGTVRATNLTTNGTNTFTYEQGSFTPRLMAFRRPTGLAYELGTSLPGPCSITASYSVQTGRYVKIGQNLTINVEIRWTISTSGVGPDDYDIFVWIPDGFNPNAIAVAGPCLNFPNTIGGITNPMGVLAQFPSFNAGGNVCAIFPTTGTGQIAYPIFAPGGTQVLQFAMTYVVN